MDILHSGENGIEEGGGNMQSIIFRIMNLKELHSLQDEIEQMSDVSEREARTKLIDKLLEDITEYDVHVREYAFKQTVNSILSRGIVLEKVDRRSVIEQWDSMFDALVNDEMKSNTKHYKDQFRWHLFSFGLLQGDRREEANARFDASDKSELYIFFDYADEAYLVKNAHMITSKDLEELEENCPLDYKDIYFFDPVNKWTYIVPHEVYLGPYFYKDE